MPDRIIRQPIKSSRKIAALNWAQEVFYRRLLNEIDDYGRIEYDPEILASVMYPLQRAKVSDRDIESWVAACQTAGLIKIYEHGGKNYLEFSNQPAKRHQIFSAF